MPSAGGVHVIIRALCRWHFQPGGGPEYCRACRDDNLPCTGGEPGADGRLCPYREHALIIDGWGLTNDGRRLIASDGSATLHFLDPDTLAELGTMKVRRKTWRLPRSQAMINEMEMVGRKIFADTYRSNEVVRIDLETGCVDGVADFSRLYDEVDREQKRQVDSHPNNVLNGIAYSKERGAFFLTGKRWPVIFELRMDT